MTSPRVSGRPSRPILVLVALVALVGACTPASTASPSASLSPASAAPSVTPSMAPPSALPTPAVTRPTVDPQISAAPTTGALPADADTAGDGTGADTADAPTTEPASAEPAAPATLEPFRINLARAGDFVAQHTFEWCVGASLQMARNIVTDETGRSRAEQGRLWRLARDHSDSPYGGANPRGWATALEEMGLGEHELVSLPTFEEAVRTAARAIRTTGKPVGLVMWRGRHAWVMTGFEGRGDPARDGAFEVTRVRVMDPLYPHGSSVWGPSPKPNSLVSLGTLGKQFVARPFRPHYDLGVAAGWLLVLPTEA